MIRYNQVWLELKPRKNNLNRRSGHQIFYYKDSLYTYGGFELNQSILSGLFSIPYANSTIGSEWIAHPADPGNASFPLTLPRTPLQLHRVHPPRPPLHQRRPLQGDPVLPQHLPLRPHLERVAPTARRGPPRPLPHVLQVQGLLVLVRRLHLKER